VTIPRERRSAPRLALVKARAAAASPRRILVVEDNADAAETLKDALELAGHRVELAFTGLDGVEKARALRPDAVICDIGLPGLDGYGVARALRADPAFASTTLIALSGYAQAEDVERARAAGFDLHLPKPPDLQELQQSIGGVARSA
jgi:CheY-like chemotaxis protein